MSSYLLINPIIDGSINTEFTAKNQLEAANMAYQSMSKYFSNSVKNFKFTLVKSNGQNNLDFTNIKDKNYYHFIVNEKVKNDDVEYSIAPYNDKIFFFDSFKKNTNNKYNKILNGGKSKFDKYDDDSDSDDYYVKKKKNYILEPINYWYYNPFIYYSDNLYVPTFVSPLNFPYVIDFSPLNPFYTDPTIINIMTKGN